MMDELRYSLLLVAAVIAVLFVVSFTAWGLTTYGSLRHVVGDLAAMPDKAASLRGQYEDMVTYFAGGSGERYTYFFQSAAIPVTRAQVSGMGQGDAISLVLDAYASGLYNDNLTAGGPGFAGALIGEAGNQLYAVVSFVLAVAVILFVSAAVLWFPERSRPSKLRGAGKAIAAAGGVAFFLFALLPGFIKSLAWGSITNTAPVRDLLSVVEPAITASLLRNTLLLIVLAGALYAAGRWMEAREGEGRPLPAGMARPRLPQRRGAGGNPKRRKL